ncbi:class F sortase [Branchiibius cervicis]|uniref:Class F sortase n=1 Tax=Branchiibius cervicis TaxID=908252 RepID=A0ABW2ANN6_9MICO
MSSSNTRKRGFLAVAGATLAAAGLVSAAAGCSQSESATPGTTLGSVAPPSIAQYVPPTTSSAPTASSPAASSPAAGSKPSATGSASSGGSAVHGSGAAVSGHNSATPQGTPTEVFVFNAAGKTIVNASLMPIFVDPQGILAPPGGVAGVLSDRGWAMPGYQGAAILAGHVTYGGVPDTFYNLPEVVPGNKIIVRYSSGDQVTFVTTKSAAKPKSTLSKDGSVWDNASPTPVLRLITCDPKTPIKDGHFEGNWVVWANLSS